MVNPDPEGRPLADHAVGLLVANGVSIELFSVYVVPRTTVNKSLGLGVCTTGGRGLLTLNVIALVLEPAGLVAVMLAGKSPLVGDQLFAAAPTNLPV
jgi:hypothetical protein